MTDPGGRIGSSFAERLTRLCETVREVGSQETLDTVRRLGRELGSDGVERFIGSFHSIAEGDRSFLKELFAGQVADPDAAAAGAKSLLTRELEGQLKQRRIEAHVTERLGINPQPEPPGDSLPRTAASAPAAPLSAKLEVRALGPQPEPPDHPLPGD